MGPTDLSAAAYAPPRHDNLWNELPLWRLQGDSSQTEALPPLRGNEAFPKGDFFSHDGLRDLVEAFEAIT